MGNYFLKYYDSVLQFITVGDINRNIAVFLQNEKWTE